MISHDPFSHCMSARPYYYDFLSEQTRGSIPESTLEHIIQCMDCQGEIDRLKTLFERLDRKESSRPSHRDSTIGALLTLHFAHIDEQVKCSTAKLFLASLADPVLQIRILTPITKHIDTCRACRDDLLSLQEMHLTHQQLCRLGRLLVDELAGETADRPSRPQARSAIDSPEPIVWHEAVCDIARRPDSGVVTRFTLHEQLDKSIGLESSDKCVDRPIDVQVLDQEQDAETAGLSSPPAQRGLILNVKRHIKPIIAAAAVILIGFALIFGISATIAVDPDRIYGAVEKAGNVHVTSFNAGETKPKLDMWVSRSLRMYMVKVGQELTLWDFRAGTKKIRSSHNVAPKAVPLTEADAEIARRRIDRPLGIPPYDNLLNVPAGAKWNRVADDAVQSDTPDRKVYDVTWTRRDSRNNDILEKCRVFVDPETKLVQKAQYYSKHNRDTDYVLRTELVVEYLSDDEMKTAIGEAFP